MKIKLKGAQTDIPSQTKSDALSSFSVQFSHESKAKYEMNDLLKGAALAMAQVNYAAGIFRTRLGRQPGVDQPNFKCKLGLKMLAASSYQFWGSHPKYHGH